MCLDFNCGSIYENQVKTLEIKAQFIELYRNNKVDIFLQVDSSVTKEKVLSKNVAASIEKA